MIKVHYIIDNDEWTDEQFNNEQDTDRTFVITREMIQELLEQKVELEKGVEINDFHITTY
jgi:hypothetical protein